MDVKNNTNKELVFYFGDSNAEEPDALMTLKVGEVFDLDSCPKANISIQEK